MAAKMLKVIRALAEDCQAQGDREMAEGITALGDDIEELCTAIIAERKAGDSGDTFAHLETRLRTTAALLKFTDAETIRGGDRG